MKMLSIISHKGGAGKTTSAVMLAEDLAGRGLRAVLVDADRQRGAGLILGLTQSGDSVQQTRNPRLRYLCSTSLPLRELRSKAEELSGLFDVAVVDTPSLDDPLARGWIQLSTHSLMVLPVEPLSIRTLDSADTALRAIQKLNPQIEFVGMLPTMFDETDATQRTLMLELISLHSNGLLSPAVPYDAGLAHRAEQQVERRTEASETAVRAYQAAGDFLLQTMGLEAQYPVAPAARPAAAKAAVSESPARSAPGVAGGTVTPGVKRPAGGLRWAVVMAALLALLLLGFGFMRARGGATGRAASVPGAAPRVAARGR